MTSAFKLLVLIGLSCGLLMNADAHKKGKCWKKKGHCCEACPEGWMELNGRCFRFVNKRLDWCSAEKACLGHKGNLASIHDDKDYNKIRALIKDSTGKDTPTWIGGTDSVKEGCWIWSDGTPYTYTFWAKGEPNNFSGVEHCMELNFSERDHPNDTRCSNKLPFVCVTDKVPQDD